MSGPHKGVSVSADDEPLVVPTGESPLMLARRRRPATGTGARLLSKLALPDHPLWLPTFRAPVLGLCGGLGLILSAIGYGLVALLQVILGLFVLLPLRLSIPGLVATCAAVLFVPALRAPPWMIMPLCGCAALGIWTRTVLLRVEWSQAALALLLDLEEYAEYVGVRKLSPTEEAQKILKGALNKVRALADAEVALAVRQVDDEDSEIVARSPSDWSGSAERTQALRLRGLSMARGKGSRASQELPRAVAEQGEADSLWVLPLRRIGYFDGAIVLSWGKRRRLPVAFPAVAQFLQRGLRQILIRYDVGFRLLHVSTRLGAVMDHVTTGIVFVDESGEPGLVNPAAAQILELSEQERSPERLRAIIRSLREDATVSDPPYKEASALTDHGTWRHELWLYREPAPRALVVSTAKLAVRQIAGEVWTFEDITDQHFAQEALAAANRSLTEAQKQAEAASVAKSQFLATVSHELRTPLNGILGMVQLLWDMDLSGELRDHLATIRTSSRILLALINNILDFTKLEAGKLALENRAFVLRVCVQEVLNILSPQALKKGLKLSLAIADGVPELVMGDVMRLQQILLNLVGNAIKFTARGEVHLGVRYAAAAPNNRACPALLRFTIRDTGIGIAADSLDRLFQPFSQVSASMARKFGGTGLGLAISRRLCDAMDGTITVESTPGSGSIFTLLVPTARAPEGVAPVSGVFANIAPSDPAADPDVAATAAAMSPTRPLTAGVPQHILVVEDNLVNQKVVLLMLRRLGCTAEVVDSGLAGLAAVRAQRFDAVFMDVEMPEMDGLATTRAIRALPDLAEQPWIVALTANAFAGDREMCAAAGMNDYLTKPLELGRLIEALQRMPKARAAQVQVPTPAPTAAPPAKLQSQPPLLNTHTLEQLRSMLGKSATESFTEVVHKFVADADQLRQEMRRAAAAADHAALARAAHTLRGTSATFGAARLAMRCRSLETIARSGPSEQQALTRIAALERVLMETAQVLTGRNASAASPPSIPVRSDFLASIAHELRTPLNAILSFSELLQPLLQSEREKSYLTAIIQSGNDLLALTGDYLDLARNDANQSSGTSSGAAAEGKESVLLTGASAQTPERPEPPTTPEPRHVTDLRAPLNGPVLQAAERPRRTSHSSAPTMGGASLVANLADPAALADLVTALQKLQTETWPMLCATQNMRLIGQFAENLRRLAGPGQSPLLLRYADTLSQQTATFDLDHLATTLTQFPEQVGRLEQALKDIRS